MALPPLSTAFRRPGTIRGAVAAGLGADVYPDDLKAEQDNARVQVQRDRLTQQTQRTIQTQQQREADRANKEAEAKRKAELSQEVAKATLVKSTLPSTLTTEQRAKIEKDATEKEGKLKMTAAAAIKAAAEQNPDYGKTTGGVLGWGAQFTPEAQKLREKAARLEDPAAVTDDDLKEARGIMPAPFEELDKIKGTLTADQEARNKRREADIHLTRAKARAAGVPDEELDSIAPLPKAGAPAVEEDPRTAHFRAVANSGALDREISALKTHEQTLLRKTQDLQAIQERKTALQQQLSQGVRGPQSARLYQEFQQLSAAEQAHAADFEADREAYNSRAKAFEAKQQMHNERIQQLQEPTAAPKTPTLNANEALSRSLPAVDASGNEIGRETSQEDTLEALAETGKKAYWSDPKRTEQPDDATRASRTQANTMAVAALQERTKARVEGQQAVRDRIADRLKRGELSVEAAAAEEDRALADYEAQHEADSQTIGSHLSEALNDFQAGKIDSDTLNTVFHAAGSSRTGVEAFKERLAGQRKDDEHVAALSAVMGGDALAGKGGETLDATTRLAVAKGKAGDEWAFAKDVVKAVATIVTPFMQDDDAKLAAGLAITGKGSDTYTKVQQAKAIQAAAALEKLRTDRRTALAQELTKRGVDVADHARLMARAELETMPADVGVLETIAARGGAESTLRQKMPFIGGLMQAERILPFAETALKLERGEQPAKEEMDALVEFIRFSQREGSGLTKVVDTLTELPAFITELASTSGIAAGVKYAGLKGAKAALQKIVTKEGRELVAQSLAKWTETAGRNQIGKRLALGLGGEALRLPVASAGRIAAGYTRDTALQGVQLSADEGQLVAQIDQNERKGGSHRLADALADSYIENLSERSGGWLGRLVPGGLKAAVSKIAAPVKDKLFKSAVVRALSARNPGMPISKLGAVLAKANFGSTLEEMGEERVGSLARDIWKGISGDGWGVTLPSAEDIGVELVSFMIPGGIGAVQTARHFGKLDSDLKASDAESTAHLQSLTDPKATAERISKLVSTEQRQVTISEQEVTAARDIIGTVDTTDTMRGIDRTTVDLLQRSEQAMEQGDLSRASRLRSMALEQSRARTATADSELIRGLQTVREIAALKQQAAGIRENAEEELSAAAGTGGTVPAAEQALIQAEQMTMAADRASALVKIARGREASLTTAEQTALQASPIPAVVQEKGGMIITDTGRAELQKVSPAAASYVRQSETERREQLAQSQTQATQAAAQVSAGGDSPTAGATPAASGVGAAQGVAAAPPAGATPAAEGFWTATGIRGTRVAINASQASTREEATTKLAQMLKGETLRAGSIQAPKAAAPQNVPANAPVTKPAAQNVATAKDHGKGASFDADQWKANATTRIARLAGDQKAFAHATVTVAELHAMLAKVGKVFAGGVEFDNGGPTSGLALDPERQSLAINVQKFAAQTAGLSGQELADFVESRVMHEVIHTAAVDVLTADQIKDLWKRLGQSEAGQKLAKDVQRAYFAAYEARNEKPPALSNFALGHELLRMCIEDKAFAKRISEAQGIDKGFVGELADFLRKISEWLTARINALPKAERATLESYRDNVIAAMEALGVPGVKAEKAPVVVQKLPVREQQASLTPTDETQNPTIQPPSSAPAPAEPAVQPAAKVDTKPAKKPAAQGKDYSAYTEEQQALLRANDERYASAKRQADAESDAQMRGKLLKAAGMRHAAEFRQITGKLTAKEQQDKDAYEASNHVGKAVSVDGQNGEIVGHAFGRVKVRMGDGAVKNVAPDMIAAPVGDEVVFVAEDLEATPETSNAPDGGQTEGGAVNSPLASETDPGTSSFAPGVQQQSPKKRKKATPKAQEATPTMDAGDKALADAFDGLYANERPVSPFYSKLERVLSAKMPNRADAQTIKGIVSNPQNGIKPEELKWSGLLTWLDGQVQPVAKQTVLDYLGNEGAVRFEEVRMGNKPLTFEEWSDELRLIDSPETRQTFAEHQARNAIRQNDDGGTKYAQWQLPGGENYREVVLAMPGQDHRLSNATFRETGKKWAAFSNADGQRVSPEFDNNGDLQTWVRGKLAETGYTSSHFRDVPDYVAHMRTNERTTQAPVRPMAEIEAAIISQWATNPPKAQNLGSGAPDSAVSKGLITPAEAGVYARHRGFRSGKYYDAKAGLEEGLFIEEIQSDRHQAGRDKGYRDETPEELNQKLIAARQRLKSLKPTQAQLRSPNWRELTAEHTAAEQEVAALEQKYSAVFEAVPDAPFRKDWALAMVKRALRDAVASGKDFIGWTVGSVQADRFNLSKQVDRVQWDTRQPGKSNGVIQPPARIVTIHPKSEDSLSFAVNDQGIIYAVLSTRMPEAKDKPLAEVIGKEMAERIMASQEGDLSGNGLNIGGQGMTGFYDNILPKEVQKYVKQWGAKVERRANGLGIHLDPENNGLPYKANTTDSPDNMPYWRVDITPAMRASVAEGQALFANERVVLTHSALPADRREAMMKAAATLVDLKLSTPQELAARLDKLAPGGQLRQYSHAFWKIMQGFSDDLPDMSKDDWAAIYNPPSTEGNRNTAMIAEAAAKLKGEKQGDKQPSVFPKVSNDTDAEAEIDSAVGDLADFLGIDLANDEVPTGAQTSKADPITDFGEKIGGARKDAWKVSGLNVADLTEMTEEERQEATTKDQVWPVPDYAQWVNDGMDPVLAYRFKIIRDSLASKPQYYNSPGKPLLDEEKRRVRDTYISRLALFRDRMPSMRSWKDWEALLSEQWGKETLIWGGQTSRAVTTWERDDHGPFTGYDRAGRKRWERSAWDWGNDSRRAREYVERTGWPLSNAPWMRSFDVREKSIGTIESVKVDGEWTRRTIEAPEFFVTKRGGYSMLADGFATRESAVAWAQERYEQGKKTGEDKKIARPLNENPQREGPDHRLGRDVTGDDLLATFGFRGGEFGNWTNQADRQQALNAAFDGLHDLARVLNIPPKAISLNGALGIAFGARGGGRHAAHYEPGRVVINLTRTQGAGALAHEWAHAMDDHFGKLATGGMVRQYVSESASTGQNPGLRTSLFDAYRGVMRVIGERTKDQEQVIEERRKKVESGKRSFRAWVHSTLVGNEELLNLERMILGELPRVKAGEQKSAEDLLEMLLTRIPKEVAKRSRAALHQNLTYLLHWEEKLARAEAGHFADAKNEPTEFFKNAKELGEYWSRKHELFARAFESYVQHKISTAGQKSEYLVHSATAGESRWGKAYPGGRDAEAIYTAFDKLFQTVESVETDKGTTLGANARPTAPDFNSPEFITKAARAAKALLVKYNTPEAFAKRFDQALKGKADARLIGRVWALSDAYDPDKAIAWTKVLKAARASENAPDEKSAQPASPVDEAAHEAATSPKNDLPEPTEAQKEAGNYKVGKVRIAGMDISIENPAGSERKGKDANGKAWSVTMADHYGYVRGSEGKDGDHIDIFIAPGTPEDFAGPVFVVNQMTDSQDTAEMRPYRRDDGSVGYQAIPERVFDEHKAIIGPSITTAKEARAEYLKNYSPGWKGAGDVVKFETAAAFREWATEKQRRGPVSQETADKFSLASKPTAADTTTDDTGNGQPDQSPVTPDRPGVAGSVAADEGTADVLAGQSPADVATPVTEQPDSGLSASAGTDGEGPSAGTAKPAKPRRDNPSTSGNPGRPADTGGSRPNAADAPGAGGVVAPQQQPDRANYVLANPDAIVGGGPKARFERNRKAIELYQDLKSSNRAPTQTELDTLAGYMGWGSFGQELWQGNWQRPQPAKGWEREDEWLRNHLGQSEWESAQRSIINAHYTDPPSVQAMWAILRKLGFTGGRVLEPSLGIGNFFGLMPADMAQNSQLTGIELDSLTGGMAQMLYPKANVRVMGYQDSKTADNFYDVVIGNWPFFEEGPPDRRYDKIGATLHDYFFIKALDQVRPGGIVIGITSSGTMDKKGVRSRAEMAKRADLVASFRLPTGAFMQYAGTKVVTDIVILQKRDKQAESTDLQNAGWLNLANVQTPGGEVEVNEYYVAHPEHILGRLNFGHGTTTYRAGMIVDRPDDLLERLQKLPDMLPEGAAMREPQGGRDQSAYITNNSTDRQNAVTEQDGKLFVVNGEHLRPLEDVVKYVVKDTKKTAKREEQLRRLVGIRRALGAVLDAQRKGAENTEALRADLRDQYQSFIKHSGAKSINTSDGLSIMERANDPFAPSLAGLEYLDGKTWKPREIFERNVMRGKPTRANPTISDAYAMARNESLTLDLGTIAKAAGVPVAEVEAELVGGGQVFKTPTGSYEPADVYLSGNVRQKLREAREAKAEGVEGMDGNIAALSAVVPADIPYFQIEANAGATWVTSSDYEDFVRHLLNSDAGDVEVKRVPSGWKVITNNDRVMNKAEATTTWGVPQMGWRKLFSALMNNATVRITYKDTDGVLQTDEKATTEANAKIDAMRDEFKRWLWSDAERTVRLEASYNEVFNAIAIPTYDGSHLAFEGLVLSRGDREFNLRSHQSNAVWRGILTGRGLYAHEVGTGKTLVMAALAMESRRLGKARKPLVLAHNANARQVAAEMQGAYPGAKILFVDNLNAATRQATLNQIALDDWDCVVMPHSIIDRLCLRPESVEAMVREEIEQLEIAAMEAAEEDDMDLSVADMDDPEAIRRLRSPTAKELVKEREKLKNMIEKARQLSEKPDSVFFEDLGVDMLTVDEAHIFKKLPVGTKQKLKGLNKAGSKRGIVLSLLTQHVKRNNGGQGVHLFTGTPITNTLNEVFNMMRYMMDDVMKRDQVDRWDGWFNTFADSTSEVELNSAGEWEAVERLAAFVNLPELRRMIGQYLDIVFADDMPEFKPRTQREGRTEDAIGRPFKKVINEIAPMTHAQKRHKEDLSERYQRWKNMTGRERVKAMRVGAPEVPIIIEGEGVKAAIDMRLIDRSMPEAQDGKIARALNNVMKHYAEHEKSTQMIFMQTGFSDFAERSTGQRTPDGKPIKIKVPVFNVAKDIKRQLIERGIPAHQIAIFSDMDAEERKIAAEQMQRGEIRVAIGSTETMGTGVNAQNELRAMHHIDAPWMPGDLEQRNGRGWRQGNRWNTVLEYRYITEGSHDGRRWQILLTKDRFIKRFMKADDSMRVIEGDGVQLDDEGGGGFEETFSAAAGDPRILQREKLSKDVNKLLDKQRRHFQAIEQAKATVRALKGKIERAEGRVPKLEADKAAYEKAKEEPFSLTLGKKTFTEREEADNAFLDLLDAIPSDGESRTVGSYRGFPIVIRRTQNAGNTTHWYDLRGQLDHAFQSKSTASMDYTLRSIADKIEREQRDISESQASLTSLAKMADTPFGQQADLERKEKMLADIIADLAANPIPAPSWLRNGAPVGTSVWVDGKEYGVAGHKANASGFQVILEGANGELRTVDFKEVQNETGLSVFEAPGEDVPDESPEVPAKPRIDSTRLLDVDKADRGLWRQREKLRAILNKLESQEETDLRAVRIANVTKALKRVEDQLLANSEGGLSANARPALGRGLGAMLGKDTAQVPQIPGVKESLTVATEQRLLTAYAKLDRTGQGYIRIPDLAREAGLSPKEASAVLGRLDSAGKAFLTPADEPRNIPAADLPYLVSGPSGKALYVTLPAEVFDYLVRSGETFSTGRDKSEGDTLAATERPSQPSDGVVAALQVLAENDELFRYPVSHSSTLQTVVKEVAPWVKYLGEDTRPDELQESGADHRHVFENLDGQVFYVYLKGRSRDGEVWIDVSRLEEGDRGAGIYAAIGNYAFNTKRTFIGDPAGLSDAATIRRTSNMLSLALRFGSTDFMEPSASQMRGIPGNNVPPLQWTGSDEQKTRALIDTFLGSLYAQQPGLKDFRYDFDSMHFIDAQGRPLGPDGFAKFGRTSLARKAKAGPATARRGVFLQSLVSEAGGTGPDLLQAIRSRGREIVLNGGLGSLFSTERPLRDDPEMAALLDALNAPFSDEQRADLYSRAGFDWGRDMTEAEARQIAENARAGSRSYYDLQRDEQTHEAWNTAAREMLARDQRGAIKELVSDAVSGNLGRNAVKVKAAQLAIPGMMVAAIANKDKQAFRDAEALTYAYDVAGTETARGLAARWKPHQTAEDAHREMLAKMIFTPSAKDRAKIERAVSRAKKNDKIKALEAEIAKVKAEANDWANAVLRRAKDQTEAATAREREIAKRFQGELITKFEEAARAERAQAAREVLRLTQELRKVQDQKDKQQLISEANEKRLAEIEQALADMGVTFHDIFVSKEAIVRLRGSALVKNVLKPLNEKERMAIKSRLEGRTDRQIARETGISERSLAGVFSQFDTALKAQISTWVDRGFSIADFEMLDSAGNRVDVGNLIDDQGNLLAANVRAANLTAEEKAARIDGIFSAIVPATKARNSGALKRVTGSQPAAPYGFDISRPEHAVVLARAIARLDSSGADMVYEYWINGLLSGPATHFANLTGNTGNAALEYAIQRPLEAITNAVLFRDAAGASLGEYKSMAKWTQRAFSNAWAFAKTAWDTEVSLFDSQWLDKPIQLRGSSGDKGQVERFAIPGKFGRFVRTPSRALQFADEFAKHFFGMLEASAQAHRLARADGLTGKALDARVEQLVSVPGSPAWIAAVDKTHRLTFTNDLPAPLQRAQDFMHERADTAMGSVAKMLLRFVFPFVRTPYNIFATGMRKTPLGSLRMGWKAGVGLVDAWRGNQAFFESYPRAALAGDIAEQLLAWTTALLLAGAAEGDPDDDKKLVLITGTRSLGDSRGEAQLLNRIRGGETSIIVNGQPVLNYGRIEPFSTIISTIVDAARELKKINGGEPAVKAFENAARNLVDQARSKTFLQGFDGLMQLLDGRVKSLPGAAVKFVVTGAVPNLVRQPLRNVDDFARDSRNASWYYQALPFGGFAEPLYDLYGRPMAKDENSVSRILTGNSNARVQPRNPADTALDRWNKDNEGDPQQKYYPVNPSVFRYKDAQGQWKDMTAQEIARFRRVAGQNFAQEAIQTFMVPRSPQKEEMRTLESVKGKTYDKAKDALFGGGVSAPMPKRQPPTLKELFGQKLRQ